MKFRTAMLAGACAVLLVAGWAITLERIGYERRQAEETAFRETANLALAFEQDAIRTLGGLRQAMLFTEHEFADDGRAVDLSRTFAAMAIDRAPFTTLSIVDEMGTVVASTGPAGISMADREYFRFHAANPSSAIHIGRPVEGRLSGRPAITVSRRIDKLDGTFGGLVLAGVSPSYFTDFFQRMDVGTRSAIQIVGEDGIIRARRSGSALSWGEDLKDSRLLKLANEAQSGSFVSAGRVDGVQRFMSYRRVEGYPLLVSVGVSVEGALAEFSARKRNYLAGATAASLLVVLFGVLLGLALRRHEKALAAKRRADEAYRQTFDSAPIGIVHQAMDGRYLKVNPAFCSMLGYAQDELLGRSFVDFLHPEDAAAARRVMQACERGEAAWPTVFKIDNRHIRKDGTEVWGSVSLSLVAGDEATPPYMVVMVEDVTERKRAEAALAESRRGYQALVDNTNDFIWEIDSQLRLVHASGNVVRLLGFTPEEMLGRTPPDFMAPAERERVIRWFQPVLAARQPYSGMVAEVLDKQGVAHAWEASAAPIIGPSGEFLGYRGVSRDVTERVKAEGALALSEARFRDLADNTPDFIWELDAKMRFTYASASLRRLLGTTPESVLGRTPVEFMTPDDARRIGGAMRALAAEKKGFSGMEHNVLDAQGRAHVWEVSGVPILAADGALAGYRGVSRDITARKAAEESLRRSEEVAKQALARSERHMEALVQVASVAERGPADLESLARTVTEAASRATGAARANLWLFSEDETQLRCIDLYEAEKGLHSAGLVLEEAQFRNEFAALKRAPFVDADDPLTDPRTAGYVESYLRPLGITSMLDVVVSVSGRHLGLLCIEHVGPRHRWEEDEIAFGCRLADKFAAAITSHEARASEERFRRYFELGLIGMAIAEPGRGLIEVNRRFADMLGYSPEALLGKDWATLTHPNDLGADLEQMGRLARAEIESYACEKRFVRRDGGVVSTNIEVRCVRKADGTPDYFVAMIEDITERKRASERIAATFHQVGVGIVTTTLQTQLLEVNERFASMLGYRPQELIGRSIAELTHPDDLGRSVEFRDGLVGEASSGFSGELEKRFVAKDGRTVWAVVTAAVVRDASGDPDYLVGVIRDVTDSKRIQEKLEYQSHYDTLTGLPNRALFMDRLGQTLSQAKRKQWATGVLVLDLDRFKTVNESFGQAAGDELLREAARRLQACIRPGDTVARLSSDEFAVVLADLSQPRDAGAVAGKILGELTRTFVVNGQEVFMSASIGIATEPPDGADVDALMRNAGSAMHKAKDAGRNNVQFYAAGMQAASGERVTLEADLRKAVERGELLLHYQPKLSLATGQVSGFEALMRWRHPSRGVVPPGRFIPVMEESGIIVQAGEWAVDAACAQIAAWRAAGLAPVPVAVNLSARQFLHHNLHAVIEAALERHGVEPSLFEIEVTESDAMRNPQEVAAVLGRMRARGHTIAVDDFGTGYSSLAYLKRLPLDTLKIDRSFITGLPADLDDASIARAVIAMAHRLGLKVVAEGVETEEQRIFLTINKCDEMQGYLFSAPLPAEECAALLRKAGSSALAA